MNGADLLTRWPRGFGVHEAVELTGVSLRRWDYWDHTGVLSPSIASASGSGSRRRWSFCDLVAASVILATNQPDRFRTAGLSLALQLDVEVYDSWNLYLLLGDPLEIVHPDTLVEVIERRQMLTSFISIGYIASTILAKVEAHASADV